MFLTRVYPFFRTSMPGLACSFCLNESKIILKLLDKITDNIDVVNDMNK